MSGEVDGFGLSPMSAYVRSAGYVSTLSMFVFARWRPCPDMYCAVRKHKFKCIRNPFLSFSGPASVGAGELIGGESVDALSALASRNLRRKKSREN